jgi:MFS family permease
MGLIVQAFAAGTFVFVSRLQEFYAVAAVVFGAATMVSNLGMALGPSIGGWIFDRLGTYSFAIALAFPPSFRPMQLKEIAT